MIPDKKKTPEELAALREELGIPDAPHAPGEHRQRPASFPPIESAPSPLPSAEREIEPVPVAAVLHPEQLENPPLTALREPIVHLDVPPTPFVEKALEPVQHQHSLRKHEIPLAPAPPVTRKTVLPTGRHDDRDIAEIRRRDAIKSATSQVPDPAAHLKKMTAGPLLLVFAYLIALGAGASAWQGAHLITPLALLILATIFAIVIFVRKKRSRHHSAILAIIILMTLVFGGLHYAPLFYHAT